MTEPAETRAVINDEVRNVELVTLMRATGLVGFCDRHSAVAPA